MPSATIKHGQIHAARNPTSAMQFNIKLALFQLRSSILFYTSFHSVILILAISHTIHPCSGCLKPVFFNPQSLLVNETPNYQENTMNTSPKVLRIKDVIQKTGLARSTIYDRISKKSPRYDPNFPKPLKLGLSAVGWFEHEIDAWFQVQASMRGF